MWIRLPAAAGIPVDWSLHQFAFPGHDVCLPRSDGFFRRLIRSLEHFGLDIADRLQPGIHSVDCPLVGWGCLEGFNRPGSAYRWRHPDVIVPENYAGLK